MRLRAVAAAGWCAALVVVLLLQLLVDTAAAEHDGGQTAELRVPRVLHRSFLSGAAALHAATQDPQSGFKAHWLASCKVWFLVGCCRREEVSTGAPRMPGLLHSTCGNAVQQHCHAPVSQLPLTQQQ